MASSVGVIAAQTELVGGASGNVTAVIGLMEVRLEVGIGGGIGGGIGVGVGRRAEKPKSTKGRGRRRGSIVVFDDLMTPPLLLPLPLLDFEADAAGKQAWERGGNEQPRVEEATFGVTTGVKP
eukprot:CAMPEP_0175047690 /NCGR_PEP_ID=MMETSP0052_2-20121109/5747_1 /TAXON_ID=51329 ORGANISM="Polytomella parva, Strain SAG 63-3" /NCGR_SAMPLE_ID=MMETSP0052_2 /ASSEMBLY_ACC=CAM_ASM_000194 /LENGTH=122 /DNA_ID=CAMNT_0016311617 /DNA_START=35 /DNA_END=403 /DNA_ORIENTATION=+